MRSCPPRLDGSALREDDQAEPRHVLGSPRPGTSPGISPQHALQCQLLGVGLAARDDRCAHAWSRVYGLGMIGAMAYFFQSAESGWDHVLVVPKASVWPALLVYKLLKSFYG